MRASLYGSRRSRPWCEAGKTTRIPFPFSRPAPRLIKARLSDRLRCRHWRGLEGQLDADLLRTRPRGYTAEDHSTAFAADLLARLVVVGVKDGGPHHLTIETPKGSAPSSWDSLRDDAGTELPEGRCCSPTGRAHRN
jgi:hypothetical protein